MASSILVRRPAAPAAPAAPGTPAVARPAWWAVPLSAEAVLVLALGAVALVAHGLNMFNYPSLGRFDDEGIYMAQAWAVLRQGQLAPYTYFYDHAPGGWILIATWMGLTGGPHTFGSALDGGRLLMLLLHLAMVPLLYRIARKLGCPPPAAALVVLLFSVSPLSVFYQRLVLLDNIMLFWILLSLDLVLDGWGRLSRVVLSGLCFGVALLTKETALFLSPAVVFMAVQQRREHQGRFGLSAWLLSVSLVASFYPLYALLKEELLPAGSSLAFLIFNYNLKGEGASLIEALQWQSTRKGGGMLNLNNEFWQLVRGTWLGQDAVLFAGGALAVLANLIRGVVARLRGGRDRRALAAGLLGAMPLLYLARGGIVFDFYVLAALPFLCLNLGVLVSPLLSRPRAVVSGTIAALAGLALVGHYWTSGALQPLYTAHPAAAPRTALSWVKEHLPLDSRIVTFDATWVDLHEPGAGGRFFPDAHPHWKVALDPAIRGGVFKEDWRTVDYVLMTANLPQAFQDSGNTIVLEALRNASLVKRWEADGDAVELWKVNKPGTTEGALLAAGTAHIAERFERGGALVRPDGTVASESQAYAMLRAVWSDDRAAFDQVWGWTQRSLVNRKGLLSWLWRDGVVVDTHAASDADTDAALALLLAGRRWNDPELLAAGRRLVQAIWEHEVITVRGKPYITAGDWVQETPVVALNPSYFSPYAYRVFQDVDPQHDWWGVVNSGYEVLFAASSATLGAERSAGLPPDWVGLDRATGQLVPLRLDSSDTVRYGYDAARTYWRVALDLRWTADGRASAYLSQAGFLRDEVRREGQVSAVYGRDGTVIERPPSVVGHAGALAALLTLDPPAAHALYANHFVGRAVVSCPAGQPAARCAYRPAGAATGGAGSAVAGTAGTAGAEGRQAVWANPDDLYAQDWAWFATALYADALANLWQAPAP